VLEKAAQLGEIGAGIQLGPNAFHCFDRLGVGEPARQMAVYIDQLRLMDSMADGEICHIDLGEAFRKRYGNPYAVVHRGDLHGVLLKACRDHPLIELAVSSEVDGLRQDGKAVTRVSPAARASPAPALIGADGLWSNVRRQVVGDGAPRVSGHTTYRSVIPTEQMPEDLRWNAATLWAGPKCHIVHYPLSGWKVFNLVVTYHNDAPEPVAGKPVRSKRCGAASPMSARARRASSATAGLAAVGAVRPRSGRRLGRSAGWRCWATPPTRCCSTWRRAPAWRWRMRSASPIRWRRPTRSRRASRPTAPPRAAHHAAAADVARPWATTSITRPAARGAAQRHHERQEPGRLVRDASTGSMAAADSIDHRAFPPSRTSHESAPCGKPKTLTRLSFRRFFPEYPAPPWC
jgi:hypothetical protein